MSDSDWISILNIVATMAAVISAPVIALYVSGRLQRTADSRAAKIRLFNTLIGLRHNLFSPDTVTALNSIDAVFVDDTEVREAWSQLIALLNDPNAQNPAGWAMRDSKRRDLLLAMVRALGWTAKISTADLMRIYQPQFVADEVELQFIERKTHRAELLQKARL